MFLLLKPDNEHSVPTRKKLTLSYQGNGGTGSLFSDSCYIDNDATSCNVVVKNNGFTKANSNFIGWEDDNFKFAGIGNNSYYKRLVKPGDTITLTSDVILKHLG